MLWHASLSRLTITLIEHSGVLEGESCCTFLDEVNGKCSMMHICMGSRGSGKITDFALAALQSIRGSDNDISFPPIKMVLGVLGSTAVGLAVSLLA